MPRALVDPGSLMPLRQEYRDPISRHEAIGVQHISEPRRSTLDGSEREIIPATPRNHAQLAWGDPSPVEKRRRSQYWSTHEL